MALQAETIVAGLVTAWEANATLVGLVPGGVWFSQVPQEVTGVYATLTLKTENVTHTSQRDYIQTYTVTVRFYGSEAMTDASKSGIRVALGTAWCSSTPTFSGATSMGIYPTDATVDLDPNRKEAADILISTASYGGMVQGTY